MNPRKALVIEDDYDLSNVVSIILEMNGYEANTISDGSQVESYLMTKTPNLILLDLHLPTLSGDKLLHQIRANKRLGQTRVVLMTADIQKASTLNSLADAVLIKPFEMDDLQGIL